MKKLFGLILITLLCSASFSCITETTNDLNDNNTLNANATGASFTTSSYVYVKLTEKKVSADNSTWASFSSETVTLSSPAVSVSYASDGLVTIDATEVSEKIGVELSGTLTTGGVKIQTNDSYEIGVYLSGVTITSSNYPCIDITKGSAASVFIEGTNVLKDERTYSSDYSSYSDNKGTLFCKAGMALNDVNGTSGSATLKITQNYKSCIASKQNLKIESGTYNLTSTAVAVYDSSEKDYNSPACINTDGSLTVSGGTVTGTSSGKGSKGIKVDGDYLQTAGTIDVTVTGTNASYGSSAEALAKGVRVTGAISVSGGKLYSSSTNNEAIESKSTITISGGEVYGYSTGDDGINASSTLTVSGGYVCGYSSANDGMDSNGNTCIKGGVVFAAGAKSPEVALDANTEDGYKLYISGGTVITLGPIESGASLSQSCYKASSWTANKTYGVTVGSTTYVFTTPSSSSSYGSGIIISAASKPALTSGATAGGTSLFDGKLYAGGTKGSSTVSLSSYSSSSGGR